MKKFKSKRDWWLTLLLLGAPVFSFVMLAIDFSLTALIILSITTGFIMWLWFGTNYVFKDKYLQLNCGPFKTKIRYTGITAIKATRNPLAAPALSLQRLEIRHKEGVGFSLVSPVDPESFIAELELRTGKNLFSGD